MIYQCKFAIQGYLYEEIEAESMSDARVKALFIKPKLGELEQVRGQLIKLNDSKGNTWEWTENI